MLKLKIFLIFFMFSLGLCQLWSNKSPPEDSSNNPIDIHFLLFVKNKTFSLSNRTYHLVDPKQKTIVLVYGWLTSMASDQHVIQIARKYEAENDYNIIYVDWSKASYNNYLQQVLSTVKNVGTKLGEMIMSLHSVGLDVNRVHLIGFSLGAHVCGIASRYIREHHPQNRTVRRISGLDPAGPLFNSLFGVVSNPYSLSASDAEIVDVTHSDGNLFGVSDRIGTVDFYINGGIRQPSCGEIISGDWLTILTVNGCSHVFSVLFFKFTVNDISYRASSSLYECKDVIIYGDKFDGNSTGIYHIEANSVPPYRTKC